jgi:hypothetical protein
MSDYRPGTWWDAGWIELNGSDYAESYGRVWGKQVAGGVMVRYRFGDSGLGMTFVPDAMLQYEPTKIIGVRRKGEHVLHPASGGGE